MSELLIIVPVKQVPDIENVKFDEEKGRIDRSSAETETNPFDLNALEEAVKLKEEVGGKVITISMGPSQAKSTLRNSLARGADEAILLSGSGFAGADTWATSYTLASAIKKIGNFDLIFCGEKTVDGDTGQVGPEIAEILDIPHVSYVSKIRDRKNDNIVVETDLWDKIYVKKLGFPALVTVTKDANEPRLPTLKDKMKAKKAEIDQWGADVLKEFSNEDNFGYLGSPTAVDKVDVPEEEVRKGEIFRDKPSEAAKKLVSRLKDQGFGK